MGIWRTTGPARPARCGGGNRCEHSPRPRGIYLPSQTRQHQRTTTTHLVRLASRKPDSPVSPIVPPRRSLLPNRRPRPLFAGSLPPSNTYYRAFLRDRRKFIFSSSPTRRRWPRPPHARTSPNTIELPWPMGLSLYSIVTVTFMTESAPSGACARAWLGIGWKVSQSYPRVGDVFTSIVSKPHRPRPRPTRSPPEV